MHDEYRKQLKLFGMVTFNGFHGIITAATAFGICRATSADIGIVIDGAVVAIRIPLVALHAELLLIAYAYLTLSSKAFLVEHCKDLKIKQIIDSEKSINTNLKLSILKTEQFTCDYKHK